MVLGELLDQLPLGIHSEYTRLWQPHLLVGIDILPKKGQTRQIRATEALVPQEVIPTSNQEGATHVNSVPKGGMKGLLCRAKKVPNVCQAGNFEHLWLFLNHLPAT